MFIITILRGKYTFKINAHCKISAQSYKLKLIVRKKIDCPLENDKIKFLLILIISVQLKQNNCIKKNRFPEPLVTIKYAPISENHDLELNVFCRSAVFVT